MYYLNVENVQAQVWYIHLFQQQRHNTCFELLYTFSETYKKHINLGADCRLKKRIWQPNTTVGHQNRYIFFCDFKPKNTFDYPHSHSTNINNNIYTSKMFELLVSMRPDPDQSDKHKHFQRDVVDIAQTFLALLRVARNVRALSDISWWFKLNVNQTNAENSLKVG